MERPMNYLKTLLLLPLVMSFGTIAAHHEESGVSQKDMMQNISVAKKWIEAGYTDKNAFSKVVKKHMAEDGVNFPGRFVGFGFTFDPQNEDMVVNWVIESSPAEGVLKPGDMFVSVEGVPATKENRDNGSLVFSGVVGAAVTAVIQRAGKQVEVSFERGIVNPQYTKAQVMSNVESSAEDSWGADEFEIIEVAANRKNNVVYVWTHHTFTDSTTNLKFEENQVTRFQFNEEHQVIARADLSEEAFVQSQLGYQVTR